MMRVHARSRVLRKRITAATSELITRIDTLRGKQPVHFLHIGKTGGSAIKHVLRHHRRQQQFVVTLHGHKTKLVDIPDGELVFFFLRDPIRRFLSGFYSAKREGLPAHYSPSPPEEKAAFKEFVTPNALARALSAADPQNRAAATRAMGAIRHVNTSYWDWFGDEEYFRSRVRDIFFIGFQERLGDDFEILKAKLGLPQELSLPRGDVEAHRNPEDVNLELDAETVANLKAWYGADYAFLELCGGIAPRLHTLTA